MKVFDKIVECLMAILPFFKKKDAKKMKEFSELVASQYEFLMTQLEKVLKDYFDLSARVKDMHAEILSLKEQLLGATAERCQVKECLLRR